MATSRSRSLTRLLAPLALVLLVAFLASCSSGDVATTTSTAAGTTGTSATGSAAVTTGGSVSSATTQVAGGSTVTPPSTSGGPAVTPPSTPPSTPGGANAANLPKLENAVKDNPNNLDALGQLAIGYYQAKEFAKAEETYKKILGIKNSAETHNNLGNVYRDWNKTDQAIEQYQAATTLDPTLVFPYSNLAAVYMMRGDTQKAIQVAESGIAKTSGAAKQQLQSLLNSLK